MNMTTSELCDRAKLDDEARSLAQPEMPLRTFVAELSRAGRVREAMNSLVQVLPKTEAIAWGLESIRRVDVALIHRGGPEAIERIEAWLAEPNEERRRAAKAAADQAGLVTPPGCLAFAVFMSGGSMAPAEAPVVPEPPPDVCGRMVAGAMSLAVALEPRVTQERLRAFVETGLRRADHLKIWENGA
jgi:hypothetical protein